MIFHVYAYVCVCIQQQMDQQQVPITPPGECTTTCYTDVYRDTFVFPDVEVYACNCAVRNDMARTRGKQDGNGMLMALPWIRVIWKTKKTLDSGWS